jgi:hypothetical protein
LRQAYKKEDGKVGFRCPGEPVDVYVRKGGLELSTCGRKCLCNGLMSTVGLQQVRPTGYVEPPLVTAGKYLPEIARIVSECKDAYSAQDVLRFLFDQVKQQQKKQALLI